LIRKAVGKTIIPASKTASKIVSKTVHKTAPKHDRSDGSHATKRHAREGAANEDIQRLHSPWQCAPPSMATENAHFPSAIVVKEKTRIFCDSALLSPHVQGVLVSGDDFSLGSRLESDANVVSRTKMSLLRVVMTFVCDSFGRTSLIATVGSAKSHVTVGL
jgi:hypothetical protein